MQLYVTPGGTWAGTEKDYIAAVKAEGLDPKTIDRRKVDVPTSKAALMEFLTFHGVSPIGGRASSPEVTAGDASPISQSPVVAPISAGDVTAPLNLDEAFRAAPIPKQVELAVALLDRLEIASRR